jgi:hypothetical protein
MSRERTTIFSSSFMAFLSVCSSIKYLQNTLMCYGDDKNKESNEYGTKTAREI